MLTRFELICKTSFTCFLIFYITSSKKKTYIYYKGHSMKNIKHMCSIAILGVLLNTPMNTIADTPQSCKVTAEISYGELVDKITILEIKSEKITDEEKLRNVHVELALLAKLFNSLIGDRNDIVLLKKELKIANQIIWDAEDILRAMERTKTFDDNFIQAARSVYYTNDKRCSLKRDIDLLLGSHIREEKSHKPYA